MEQAPTPPTLDRKRRLLEIAFDTADSTIEHVGGIASAVNKMPRVWADTEAATIAYVFQAIKATDPELMVDKYLPALGALTADIIDDEEEPAEGDGSEAVEEGELPP
ncbi:MAG: hypothetical protein ACRECQ_00050 [Burkholderiaceae bacterium]